MVKVTTVGHVPVIDMIGSREAAELLGMNLRTFNRRVTSGAIRPSLTLAGSKGARLFDRAVIEALAEEQREAS